MEKTNALTPCARSAGPPAPGRTEACRAARQCSVWDCGGQHLSCFATYYSPPQEPVATPSTDRANIVVGRMIVRSTWLMHGGWTCTHLCIGPRIEDDIRFGRKLSQPLSTRLLNLDANSSRWECFPQIMNASQGSIRNPTLLTCLDIRQVSLPDVRNRELGDIRASSLPCRNLLRSATMSRRCQVCQLP